MPANPKDVIDRVVGRYKIRLSFLQYVELFNILAIWDGARPDPDPYIDLSWQLRKIPVACNCAFTELRNVRRGYNGNEVVPLPGFNAAADLPEGYALWSCFDSGGNHKVCNAVTTAFMCIWNHWESYFPAKG